MLTAQLVTSDVTLNNYQFVSTLTFIPGEQTRLAFTIIQPNKTNKIRYVVADAGFVEVILRNADGSTLTKTMSPLTQTSPAATDRATWFADLSELETTDLLGGNFTFSVDVLGDGTEILKGWVQNGLSRIITDGGC